MASFYNLIPKWSFPIRSSDGRGPVESLVAKIRFHSFLCSIYDLWVCHMLLLFWPWLLVIISALFATHICTTLYYHFMYLNLFYFGSSPTENAFIDSLKNSSLNYHVNPRSFLSSQISASIFTTIFVRCHSKTFCELPNLKT